jgi:hypothetical protein
MLELALEPCERQGRSHVRTRSTGLAAEEAILAPLQRARSMAEEPRPLSSDLTLTLADRRRWTTHGERAERERDGVAGDRFLDAVETVREIGAVRDCANALSAADDARTLADVPSDRRQRVVIAAHAADSIVPAAFASNRVLELGVDLRELHRGFWAGARAREPAPQNAVFASPRGDERPLREDRARTGDHACAPHGLRRSERWCHKENACDRAEHAAYAWSTITE